jgi:hypothetical protein
MKQAVILILAVLLLSCNTHESKEIELVAYRWSMLDKPQRDTFITRLYAQINKKGNCILNIKHYGEKNRFITFKIDKEILDSVYSLVYKADSDTSVCKKGDPFCLYEGPSIRVVGKNKNGKPVKLRFIDSDRSNLNCLKLYNYIDSISRKFDNNSDIDTIKILQAKEKLIKEIYKKEVVLLPPRLDSSIHFIAPVIKKNK